MSVNRWSSVVLHDLIYTKKLGRIDHCNKDCLIYNFCFAGFSVSSIENPLDSGGKNLKSNPLKLQLEKQKDAYLLKMRYSACIHLAKYWIF